MRGRRSITRAVPDFSGWHGRCCFSRDGSDAMNRTAKWIAAGAGIVSATYATYVATAWLRYGRRKPASGAARDALLDAFMPRYDVCERHAIDLATPAEVTLAAAKNLDLNRSPLVRAIFKGRELLLR